MLSAESEILISPQIVENMVLEFYCYLIRKKRLWIQYNQYVLQFCLYAFLLYAATNSIITINIC